MVVFTPPRDAAGIPCGQGTRLAPAQLAAHQHPQPFQRPSAGTPSSGTEHGRQEAPRPHHRSLAEASLARGPLLPSSPIPTSRGTHLGEQTQLRNPLTAHGNRGASPSPRRGSPAGRAAPLHRGASPVPSAGRVDPWQSHSRRAEGAGGKAGTRRARPLGLLWRVEGPGSTGDSGSPRPPPHTHGPQEPPAQPQPAPESRCAAEARSPRPCAMSPASCPVPSPVQTPGDRSSARGPSRPRCRWLS